MRNNYDYETVRNIALYMIENDSTLRKVEIIFHIPKSTIHNQLLKRLKEDDNETFLKVRALLDKNKMERASRGGNALRQKFLNKAS